MNEQQTDYWNSYLQSLPQLLQYTVQKAKVSAGMAGNLALADALLELYLSGQKTAGSGLMKDYQRAGDPLPAVGDHWIILNRQHQPRCIVKTVRVALYTFANVPEEVAIAEGEGDLSLAYWRQAHLNFFTPFLTQWGIEDREQLEQEIVVTEFFEKVYDQE